MKNEYIITPMELASKGLDLNDYARDPSDIPSIITQALDIAITRICSLGDNIKNGELGIEAYLTANPERVYAFKKLQHRILYNMVFTAETSPVDSYVDSIIVYEIGCSKINGFQKGLYYSNNK